MVTTVKRVMLLDHSAVWGGGEVAIYNICKHLDGKKVRPLVVTATDGPFVERLRKEGLAVKVAPLSERVRAKRKDTVGMLAILDLMAWLCIFRYVFSLVRLIRAEQIDIVHTCSLKAHLYGGLAAKLARKKLVWHVLDHIDTPYLPQTAVFFLRVLAKALPDIVVAISASNARTLRVRPEKLKIINCGTVVDSRPEPVPPLPPCKIALIGRIAPWKGQMVFLEAARLLRHEPVEFIVAGAPLFGEQDYEQKLLDFVAANNLVKVKFTGFIEQVGELLKEAHIVAHCSTIPEPFGQVVIEAMAGGRMVIAADAGGPAEIVVNGRTGLLVEPGDPFALAAAIKKVLADPGSIGAYGCQGFLLAGEKYGMPSIAGEWEALYTSL